MVDVTIKGGSTVDITRLRPLRPQEVLKIAAEITSALIRDEYREFAESVYGRSDVVLHFELDTEYNDLDAEYNDEGGYYDIIAGITASDPVTGEDIPYNFNASFWTDAFAGTDVEPEEYDELAAHATLYESDVIDALPVPDSWETDVDLRDGIEKVFKLYIEE